MSPAPKRERLLPYGHQWITDDDASSVSRALLDDWITQGPKVEEFEKQVASYCGARYAVAVCNGTAALHAACAVAGIGPGDEVITTPITFAASANAILYCGGTPVFADIRRDTLNIDPEEIRKKITPKIKVIIPVDFAGHPADLDEINSIAREHGLTVIEDAAHAFGAKYKGKRIGSLSDMTILSFHPVKHITTGEGGMVLTNNERFYEALRAFRHHGITKDPQKLTRDEGAWYYEIHDLGYNLRITDFQCALGLSQLERIDQFVSRRREIARRYTEALRGLPEVTTPVELPGVECSYHIYVIRLRTELLRADRRQVFEALRQRNIGVMVHYVPVHYHPLYQKRFGYKEGDYPVAEDYYRRALTLPLFPRMTDEDVEYVVDSVKEVIAQYKRQDGKERG